LSFPACADDGGLKHTFRATESEVMPGVALLLIFVKMILAK
jgi:hypothetical protein